MKNVLRITAVVLTAMMMSGCTKCSQEQPMEPPPVVEPGTETAPDGAPVEDTMDTTDGEAAPAEPTESTDEGATGE